MKQPSFSGKLTSMLERMRLLVPAALLLLLALLILPQASSSLLASDSPRIQSDDKQVESFISLYIATSNQAVSPGELVSLDVFVTNNGVTASTPSIHLSIPDVFSIDLTSLPMGTSFNVQNNGLDWSPTVPGNGGSSQSRILLRGLVADIKEPDQLITAILRDGDSQREVTSSIWLGVPISAQISFSPPTAAVGQSIRLISEVNGPGPVSQLWSLGDGRIVEAVDPEVIYAAPGTYEVILQAANPLGPTTAKSFVEIVSHPIAKFSISDSAPEIGEPVIFTHTGGGTEPMSYHWDFGDGFSSSEPNPIHSYSSPGRYLVRLETHNEFGGSEAYLPIAVGETPISDVVISEEIQAGQVLEARAFFDESTTAIFWDMGDGSTYEGEAINHVYWRSGDFLVKIRVANEFGETLIERWVNVTPGPLFLYLPIVLRGGDTEAVAGEVTRPLDEDSVVAENISIPLEELELPEGLNQAEQLLAYINEARRLNGLAELTYAYELSVAAQSHTNDMALNGFIGHEGSDGSTPAWRVGIAEYPGGYAGEATAWGMQRAIEPVQFWLSSPDHRAIMLNPLAGEVGVGFTEDYSAPNIWYWTAEFGSPGQPPVRIELPVAEGAIEEESGALPAAPAALQLLGPPHDSEFAIGIGNSLIFTWQWTEPLQDNQRFGLYIRANGRTIRIGSIEGSDAGGQYQFSVSTTNVPVPPGTHEWQVRLEEGDSSITLLESEYWPIRLIEAILPTPTVTLPPAESN